MYLSSSPQHIVIVGGGFSGTLLAINLARHFGPRITLIERGKKSGGLAYNTQNLSHLLNVRANNMSAFPDLPDHFADWFSNHGGCPDGFASRAVYGRYLSELLEKTQNRHTNIDILTGNVQHAEVLTDSVKITVSGGRQLSADIAVLAVGNLPPHPPPGFDPPMFGSLYASDPWNCNFANGLNDTDRVLLIGTGLTAIDAALTLDDASFNGTIIALSRRGLLPHAHGSAQHANSIYDINEKAFIGLLRSVRRRANKVGWRTAVDELRPLIQRIWQRANDKERAQFLRHLRPWWDVHRHRIAPQVAARIEEMQLSGRLQVVAGHIVATYPHEGTVRVVWRIRGSAVHIEDQFTRIVNCTGPGGDLTRSSEPLLNGLTNEKIIRADATRLGIDVDAQCRTINSHGQPNDRLLAIGPLTRGTFWEITSVPDIRRQVWDMARRLSNAHWVEGNV
ncbi:MAG: FAD/NAD(P)-binding protein [Sphingorhabdus sp.]